MTFGPRTQRTGRIFAPGESEEILRLARSGVGLGEIGRRFGCGHQTVDNHLASLEVGKLSRPAPVEIPCMRCRRPFMSEDRRSNRLCEGCRDYADDAARGCLL